MIVIFQLNLNLKMVYLPCLSGLAYGGRVKKVKEIFFKKRIFTLSPVRDKNALTTNQYNDSRIKLVQRMPMSMFKVNLSLEMENNLSGVLIHFGSDKTLVNKLKTLLSIDGWNYYRSGAWVHSKIRRRCRDQLISRLLCWVSVWSDFWCELVTNIRGSVQISNLLAIFWVWPVFSHFLGIGSEQLVISTIWKFEYSCMRHFIFFHNSTVLSQKLNTIDNPGIVIIVESECMITGISGRVI